MKLTDLVFLSACCAANISCHVLSAWLTAHTRNVPLMRARYLLQVQSLGQPPPAMPQPAALYEAARICLPWNPANGIPKAQHWYGPLSFSNAAEIKRILSKDGHLMPKQTVGGEIFLPGKSVPHAPNPGPRKFVYKDLVRTNDGQERRARAHSRNGDTYYNMCASLV